MATKPPTRVHISLMKPSSQCQCSALIFIKFLEPLLPNHQVATKHLLCFSKATYNTTDGAYERGDGSYGDITGIYTYKAYVRGKTSNIWPNIWYGTSILEDPGIPIEYMVKSW